MRRVTWQSLLRASAAEEKRRQRQERIQLRALERSAKEQAKLTLLEQARLEVATHEAELDVLLSVHKDQSEPWDWAAIEAALPPVEPKRQQHRELRATQNEILAAAGLTAFVKAGYSGAAADGRLQDDREYQAALKTYAEQKADWEEQRSLAHRIRGSDCAAFAEALAELNPFSDASDICASVAFTVHNRRLVGCTVKVRGTEIIPEKAKTLTTTGKVSVKAMAQKRFHEIFQDYVCGCALRVARETFAIIPIDVAIVTATVDVPNPITGVVTDRPVLSVFIPRSVVTGLAWDRIDPSDAMELFVHRGDVKASRKTGEFLAIEPFTPNDLPRLSADTAVLAETVRRARELFTELSSQISELRQVEPPASPTEALA